ncbi:MAG: dTMP kinase [Candidatus Micrarchaeia archaeon]
MVEKKGKFIVLEGIDGCGKSTHIKNIANYLFAKDKSNHILITREPTMISSYGKKVRDLLKKQKNTQKNAALFTKLYVNDRKFHIKKMVIPAMKEGCIVISDRYKYSTFAYQLSQGDKLENLIKLHKGLVVPDLVLILDISEEESIKRISDHKEKELFEKKEFLSKVRENYLKMKELFPNENIVIIDGERNKDAVFESIKKEIDKLFEQVRSKGKK